MSYKNILQEHNTKIRQAIDKTKNLSDTDASVEDLSAEIESQAQLITLQTSKINELITELNGKAAGGSGSALETCTLKVEVFHGDNPYEVRDVYYPTLDEHDNIVWEEAYFESGVAEISNVVVGQVVIIKFTVYFPCEVIGSANVETIDALDIADYYPLLIRCTTGGAESSIQLQWNS